VFVEVFKGHTIDLEKLPYLLLECAVVQVLDAVSQGIAFGRIRFATRRLSELVHDEPKAVSQVLEHRFGEQRHPRPRYLDHVLDCNHELHEANGLVCRICKSPVDCGADARAVADRLGVSARCGGNDRCEVKVVEGRPLAGWNVSVRPYPRLYRIANPPLTN
jgi:hypothetical protein